MEIAHLQLLSLLDYPGKVSAVVWTVGCNLCCPFCYNAELVLPGLADGLPRLPLDAVVAALAERARFLDGLVVTGGEPTLHRDLPLLLKEVKELGLLVKLDTNGTRPAVLRSLLEDGLVDYVALDVKAPFARYPEFTGLFFADHVPDSSSVAAGVREAVTFVREHAPDYEFRTTVAPGLVREDLIAIAGEISDARRYVLQPFFPPEGKRLVDEGWRGRPALTVEELRSLLPELQKIVPTELRG